MSMEKIPFDKFLESMRQEIREEGFMAATKLSARIILRAKERSMTVDCDRVLDNLLCHDVHVMEYANILTVHHRRKNLYYFNPDSVKS